MSTRDVANKLVALCREGKNMEAVETLYAQDIVSVEAQETPGFPREMKGMDAIVGKTKWWGENHEIHSSEVKGPWFHGDDRFAVYFSFDATMKQSGQRMQMDEVGIYTVKDGVVVREEFYFNMG